MQSNLQDLKGFLSANSATKENKLPWAYFNESEDALGGLLTNVGIIVPESIYSLDCKCTSYFEYSFEYYGTCKLTSFEWELAKRIKRCRLMN